MFAWLSLVTVLALLMYFTFVIMVGRTRAKVGIKPPVMTGNPELERAIRVHGNTLEQMIVFLPALWLFGYYVDPLWASGLGVLWIAGRILYAWGYYQAAEKRGPGFGISTSTTIVLVLGALIGIVRTLL
jgi:uncharacterized membrane protein YecN with MAPEG domain